VKEGEWFVDIRSRPARAVLDMFGYEGNTEDYWMGTPYDRPTEGGWVSANDVVRDMRKREIDEWTRSRRFKVGDREETRESIEQLVEEEPNAHDRAGGFAGDMSLYFRWKNGLIGLGRFEDE